MKKVLFLSALVLLTLSACGNRSSKKAADTAQAETTLQAADPSTVYVYYFHGKQRCKTCVAVGDVSEQTVKDLYGNNPRVKFVEVKTHEEQNAPLVEKYEVTWNALIVAKGDESNEITKYAFANAVSSPDVLRDLIKTEVDKRL